MLLKISVTIILLSLILLLIPAGYGTSFCDFPVSGIKQSGNYYAVTLNENGFCLFSGFEKKISFYILRTTDESLYVNVSGMGRETFRADIPEGRNYFQFEVSKPGLSYIQIQTDSLSANPEEIIIKSEDSVEYTLFKTLLYSASFLSLLYIVFSLKKMRDVSYFRKSHALYHSILIFLGFYIFILEQMPVLYIGDEPHYMLMAESMIMDSDLNLDNQYAVNSKSLFTRDMDRHTRTVNSKESPLHFPLLALIQTPSFLGQKLGFYMNPVFAGKYIMLILSSVFSGFLFASFLSRMKTAQLPVLFLMISGLPMVFYSNQIYPEVIAAFLITGLYFILIKEKAPLYSLTIPAISFLLLFLHLKYFSVSLMIILYWNYLNKNRRTLLFQGNLMYLSGFLLFIFYNFYFYGMEGLYSKNDMNFIGLPGKYSAYLFDADRGIFAMNPLLLFFIPGWIMLYRRNKVRGLFVLFLISALHLQNLFHSDFWLGICPAGRYWTAAYPLIAVTAFEGFFHLSLYTKTIPQKFMRIAYSFVWNMAGIFFFIFSFLQLLFYIKFPALIFTHLNHGYAFSSFIKRITDFPLEKYLFSYFNPGSEKILYSMLAFTAVFAVFSFVSIRKFMRK